MTSVQLDQTATQTEIHGTKPSTVEVPRPPLKSPSQDAAKTPSLSFDATATTTMVVASLRVLPLDSFLVKRPKPLGYSGKLLAQQLGWQLARGSPRGELVLWW